MRPWRYYWHNLDDATRLIIKVCASAMPVIGLDRLLGRGPAQLVIFLIIIVAMLSQFVKWVSRKR